ncbi:MAG: LamG domain-containing protein, partial [Phycisphaerales bacterium]
DGQWHHVTGVFDNGLLIIYIDGAPEPSTTGGQTFGSGNTRYGFIGANSEATSFDGSRGGGTPVVGEVDDIRIYQRALTQAEIALVMRGDPRYAWAPSPANGSLTGINVASALNWSAGDGASEHDVYFGTDQAAVIDADTSDTTGLYKGRQSAASYAPSGITENSGPYYWRIDEVAGDGSIVRGSVWSFSAADYVLIDDFESYNDIAAGELGSNLVYIAWVDGFDNPAANGSTMGYVTGASMETISVHSGDKSVPFQYNNTTAGVSEVVRTFTPAQNWTEHGAQSLSLWFFGDASNVPGQLYIKVNRVKVSYDREAANLSIPVWQPWNIDLASIGVNLQSVTSMAIGIEGASATGTLLLDDIRLYPYASELFTPVQPDPAGLFGHWKFDEGAGTIAQDSSGSGHDGTLYGDPLWVLGHSGQALDFDGTDDYVEYDLGADQTWTAYSVSVWAKADALALAQYKSVFSSHTPNNLGFQMDVDGTDPGSYRYYGVVTGTHFYGPLTTDWVHLATTCDGTTTILYYNGHQATTINGANLVFNRIGVGLNRNEDNFYEGIIDEFRIYDRALSPEEIAGLAGLTQPFDKPF